MTSEKLPEIKEQEIVIGQQMKAKDSVLTVINDSPYDANVLVLNGTLGPYACGYIKKGNQLALPTGIATAVDVFVLFEFDSHIFIEWIDWTRMKIYYHKLKNWVEPGTKLKISEM
jgi:hypothetical protein